MSRIVWSPETGWTDDGPEAKVALDERGRLTSTPVPDYSPEYGEALTAHNTAQRMYTATLALYRAREIGDDEYLAARREYEAATAAFDAAYAKEQRS